MQSTPGCELLNFMCVIDTPEKKLMSYRGLTTKIRMNREKNGGHLISFYEENRPRDLLKNTVTYVTVQNS
jgi:hypothetical protein